LREAAFENADDIGVLEDFFSNICGIAASSVLTSVSMEPAA
jgi:hypothetical protein